MSTSVPHGATQAEPVAKPDYRGTRPPSGSDDGLSISSGLVFGWCRLHEPMTLAAL